MTQERHSSFPRRREPNQDRKGRIRGPFFFGRDLLFGYDSRMKPRKNDWVELKGNFRISDIDALEMRGPIEKVAVTETRPLSVGAARAFARLQGVKWLWLWSDVPRSAIEPLLTVRGLKTLDILALRDPGKLSGFELAESLTVYRCNHYMTAGDVQAEAKSKSIHELGAQNAQVSASVIERLLEMPYLESLDLEGTRFNDDMARQLSQSKRLRAIDLGATKLTGKGLKYLSQMHQLRELDLWATAITQRNLDLLRSLPNLEYLSVGGYSHEKGYDAQRLLKQLASFPSLKRIWLDGVRVNEAQKAELERRYSYVRLT